MLPIMIDTYRYWLRPIGPEVFFKFYLKEIASRVTVNRFRFAY